MASSLFFIEHRGTTGAKWFLEVDRDENSREFVVELIATGDANPVKVLEVCEDENWVHDVTDEILREAEDEKQNRAERAWERQCQRFYGGDTVDLRQVQIEAMRVK